MKILTTLAEKDYFLGLAALINSVVKNGTYVDKVVVGYRYDLPNWLPPLKKSKNGLSCILRSGLNVEFVSVEGNLHMVHEKPKWFDYLTNILEPQAEEFFFFDSDIVIINRMSFFGEWIKQGVALCEDISHMSNNHPIRKQWAKLAFENGFPVNNILERYFNSGFLGWCRADSVFIEQWHQAFKMLSNYSGDMKQFRTKDRSHLVVTANQDSLNIAAMITEQPLSTIGPEAMGFHCGFPLMSHPIGPKPWRRNFWKDFFKGHSPRHSDLIFWQNVNGSELKPLNKANVTLHLITCKVLKGLSRFYGK